MDNKTKNKRSLVNIVSIVVLSVITLLSSTFLFSAVEAINQDLDGASTSTQGLFTILAIVPTILSLVIASLAIFFLFVLAVNPGSKRDFGTWPTDRLKRYYKIASLVGLFGVLLCAAIVIFSLSASRDGGVVNLLLFGAFTASAVILICSSVYLNNAQRIRKLIAKSQAAA